MATWDNLTPEQRDIYSAFEKDLRSVSGLLQRFLNTAASLKSRYDVQILPILADLTDNTVVPNSSGLAGSSSLDSDADMAALYGDLTSMLTTFNSESKQQKRAKAAGQNVNGSV
jgi:hypothetical protein